MTFAKLSQRDTGFAADNIQHLHQSAFTIRCHREQQGTPQEDIIGANGDYISILVDGISISTVDSLVNYNNGGGDSPTEFLFLGSGLTDGGDPYTFEVHWLETDNNPAVITPINDILYSVGAHITDGKLTVVPVPGAVLLGMLGLSAAGVKMRRRFA